MYCEQVQEQDAGGLLRRRMPGRALAPAQARLWLSIEMQRQYREAHVHRNAPLGQRRGAEGGAEDGYKGEHERGSRMFTWILMDDPLLAWVTPSPTPPLQVPLLWGSSTGG
jgi:hypothetical protein